MSENAYVGVARPDDQSKFVAVILPPSGNIVRNPPTTMSENVVRNCQADGLYELKYVSIMCCLQLKSTK